jgi:hypothetical protein
MVEERKTVDEEALEPGKILKTVAKPFRMWASVYLCMSWRKLKSVGQVPHRLPYIGQNSPESRQSDYTWLVDGELYDAPSYRIRYRSAHRNARLDCPKAAEP